MKSLLVFCLTLILLVPTATAVEETFPCLTSDWAREGIAKAVDLGVVYKTAILTDTREPITRGDFAENAACLVAIEFGSNLESYRRIICCRAQIARNEPCYSSDEPFDLTALDVAKNLGIIQGRGDGDVDMSAYITRQEAAVMLARTYRAYQGQIPDTLQSISFVDKDDIAAWALDDIRLMNQLGIMTGVGEGRFNPMGSYTIEQCLISLLRLHERVPYDGSKQENPFAIPVLEGGVTKNWEDGSIAFIIETDEYYILSWTYLGSTFGAIYYIDVIDQNFYLRSYHTAIITNTNYYRGDNYARPENAYISGDGTKLIYTATVTNDVYYTDEEGYLDSDPVQLKGIYTVTMNLKTGEQSYTRIDWTES